MRVITVNVKWQKVFRLFFDIAQALLTFVFGKGRSKLVERQFINFLPALSNVVYVRAFQKKNSFLYMLVVFMSGKLLSHSIMHNQNRYVRKLIWKNNTVCGNLNTISSSISNLFEHFWWRNVLSSRLMIWTPFFH